jgi:mannose-6-phosphate isomerase-like protein (cupin superfamily)
LTGEDTARRFCLIDMHAPPGGSPPPHCRDFEEAFVVLEGEIEATSRGVKSVARAGDTIHIPANAPHQFHNKSDQSVRLLCIGLSCWTRRVLHSGGSAGCNPHYRSAKTGRGRSGRVHREGRSAGPEV